MTALQPNNEKTSIEAFVRNITEVARERACDTGTACVIMSAARAAADMAPRKADGSIDEDIARVMLRRATRALARTR